MSERNKRVLALATGYLHDAATLEQALELLPEQCEVHWIKLDPEQMSAADWDALVARILSSEMVVTV